MEGQKERAGNPWFFKGNPAQWWRLLDIGWVVVSCCKIPFDVFWLRIYLFEGEFGWRLSKKNELSMECGMEVVGRLWDRSGAWVEGRRGVGEGYVGGRCL